MLWVAELPNQEVSQFDIAASRLVQPIGIALKDLTHALITTVQDDLLRLILTGVWEKGLAEVSLSDIMNGFEEAMPFAAKDPLFRNVLVDIWNQAGAVREENRRQN